ncbi:hypothetical protein C0W80_00935 [Photobacterium leiognathi subsp. mandapamensis]|uniref:hypothetical protein n=1 Tax=Photobacterium leiognathi TaxID=553611 RepID=UPI000D1675C9|nr:hypothetical protein [Photobacterium leiognathi]PSV04298.1 hypothetical protein C0W80_00935 [Photobacterium leiognathi subsp. mandapamensis]
MFLTFLRFLILSICLGATSLASASTHVETLGLINSTPTMQTISHSADDFSDYVSHTHIAPVLSSSNSEHHLGQSSGKHHPLTQGKTNQALPVSVNGSKLVWNFPLSSTNRVSEHGKHHRIEFSNYNIALGTSNRLINAIHLSPEEVSPDYRLAFEFPILTAIPLTVGYAEPLSPTVEWALKVKSSSSRISGWKDSNLIYSQYGQLRQVA